MHYSKVIKKTWQNVFFFQNTTSGTILSLLSMMRYQGERNLRKVTSTGPVIRTSNNVINASSIFLMHLIIIWDTMR